MTWWGNGWSEWQSKQIDAADRRAVPRRPFPILILFLATGFLSGFVPYLPGTAGTLVGVALYALVFSQIPPLLSLGCLLLLLVLGSWICGMAEGYLGKVDAAPIVLDEIAGYLVSVALLPYEPLTVWGGFLLFRLFDITKPPPIRAIQSLKGGWGVMADDLIAGVYAQFALRVFLCLRGG